MENIKKEESLLSCCLNLPRVMQPVLVELIWLVLHFSETSMTNHQSTWCHIPQDYIIYISPKSHKKFIVPQQMCYALRNWFSNFRVERTVRGVCYCFMKQQWVGLKEEETMSWQSSECFSLVSLWLIYLLGYVNEEVIFTSVTPLMLHLPW